MRRGGTEEEIGKEKEGWEWKQERGAAYTGDEEDRARRQEG